jgi:hypothetical protein
VEVDVADITEAIAGAVFDAAPRQGALDSTQATPDEARRHIESLGLALSVRQLTPASAGFAVRIVVDGPLWVDPKDAHLIAQALDALALEAVNAEQAARRG